MTTEHFAVPWVSNALPGATADQVFAGTEFHNLVLHRGEQTNQAAITAADARATIAIGPGGKQLLIEAHQRAGQHRLR